MAKVIGIRTAKSGTQTIYDPTCGSGSLLLKGHDEAKSATGKDLAIYGQENDLATWALAKMNMFLHDCPSAEVWKGNTLSSPHFTEKGGLKTFDFVVANPPFSSKAWSNGVNTEHDPFGRFAFGVPPTKNGDYAFLLHVLASLKSTGKGAIIMPHAGDERKMLKEYLVLIEQEAAANNKVKEAVKALEAKVATKYGKLNKDEIKILVVDDKWMGTLAAVVQSELDRVSQALTGRIKQLAERYSKPLPELTKEVAAMSARVNQHLKKMGATWN